MSGPLAGLRVLDLSSGPAAGLATMVLADFGADVVKVEPPGGDPLRRLPNAPLWLRGKRSVAIDLDAAGGARERLAPLLAGADVLVESFAPGGAAALGLGHGTLAAAHPALVTCSVTGWGASGPYAHYPADEGLVAARSGRMGAFRGLPRRGGPAFAAVPVGTHGCAQAAVQGILAALLERERSGRGQRVETSLLQGMIPFDTTDLVRVQLAARHPDELGTAPYSAPGQLPTLNYHPVMTKDGRWIQLGNLLEHLFSSFLAAADLIELIAGEGYRSQPTGWSEAAREAARDRILLRMREETADEWMARFRANGNVAAEPFASTRDALGNVELVANGDVVEVDHPRLGRVHAVGPIAHLAATPARVDRVEPEVGEHTAEVLASPWPARAAPVPAVAGAADGGARAPLDGVTILEFATIIATPLAAGLLADLGARVIKVEPIGGDPGRRVGGALAAGLGAVKYNVGKESICVDLKSPDGREVIRRLLPTADVVLHNYRPGVPERLGIGYEDARALNPRIVWVSANGYGARAPGAHRPCAHPIAGAFAGGALHQAGAGMPPTACASLEELREAARWLMRANEVNPDPNTSMAIATAVLLGVTAVRRQGIGQRVFVNMLAANVYANHDDAIDYAGKPPRRAVDAEVLGLGALYRLYEAAEGWVFLAAEEPGAFDRLCAAAGRDDLAHDPRFAGPAARSEHDAALASELVALFRARDADAWERALIAAGVGCVRADADTPGSFWLRDPHARANGLAVETVHPRYGPYVRHGPIVHLGRTPPRCGPGTLAGQHTDAVLASAGYDAAAIADLRARGVVWAEEA